MKKTKKQSLNKKPVVAIIISGFMVAAIGGVLAFRSDITRFINGLTVGEGGLKMTYTEDFTSPDNWVPCTTTPKTVIATNNDSDPVIVRVSYNDYWKSRQDSGYLPLKQGGIDVAVINFDNEEDWTLNEEDGWYYYKEPLQPGESTSSFMTSVTFNCSYNLGSNTLNVCDDQGNCTTPINPYANAKYHVEVTVQTTATGASWPTVAVCNSKILYHRIACHTNGTDESINFRQGGTQASGNGNGIYTRAPYANDNYPLYYYRGQIDNNYVVWAGFCWQILRTTNTGGVKIIYHDVAQQDNNGIQTCRTGSNVAQSIGIENPNRPFNYTTGFGTSSPAFVYYMYGGPSYYWGGTLAERSGHSAAYGAAYPAELNDGYGYTYARLGTGITIGANGYTPIGDVIHPFRGDIFGHPSEITNDMLATHRYACDDQYNLESVYCARGAIFLYENRIFRLLDGELSISDAMNNLLSNTYDSRAKKEIDTWYAANLTAYTSQLEDTVFCNDRRYTGYLANSTYESRRNQTRTDYMGGGSNLTDPRIECARKIDSFTVNESAHGNGALTYPVGLPTLSEAVMAGTAYGLTRYGALGWLNAKSGQPAWTMTPYYDYGAGEKASLYVIGDTGTYSFDDSMAANSNYLRAVVSLKPGTKYISGDGTAYHPYIIR